MTAGLVRACRSVIRHSPGPEPDWSGAPQRIVATCGQMVIAGGLERMTFEVLRVLRDRGMAAHSIVNGWENFRITPLADASGASWSVGPYWYPLKRRSLTPATVLRMLVEVVRVSGNLLRVSWRVRPTHVLVPDFEAVLRNLPALAWLRARGVRVISRLGTAPPPGRFYATLWRRIIDPVVDRFVANSEFTRRELLAHGIAAEKIETIENMAPRRKQPPSTRHRQNSRPGDLRRPDHPRQGPRSAGGRDRACCAAAASTRRSTSLVTSADGKRRSIAAIAPRCAIGRAGRILPAQ